MCTGSYLTSQFEEEASHIKTALTPSYLDRNKWPVLKRFLQVMMIPMQCVASRAGTEQSQGKQSLPTDHVIYTEKDGVKNRVTDKSASLIGSEV